jgi:hypothetical protein
MKFGVTEEARGKRVRAKGGTEEGTIARYDLESFYIVELVRNGERVELVVHEDDVELSA